MRIALLLCALLPACGPGISARYAAGNQALSSGDGPMYFVVIAPKLQQALNACIPPGLAGASPTLVIVADIDAAGTAHDLEVEPGSPGRDCMRDALRQAPFPQPPLAPGASTFPIGLRIDTEK
jgi:hypothetical protein